MPKVQRSVLWPVSHTSKLLKVNRFRYLGDHAEHATTSTLSAKYVQAYRHKRLLCHQLRSSRIRVSRPRAFVRRRQFGLTEVLGRCTSIHSTTNGLWSMRTMDTVSVADASCYLQPTHLRQFQCSGLAYGKVARETSLCRRDTEEHPCFFVVIPQPWAT